MIPTVRCCTRLGAYAPSFRMRVHFQCVFDRAVTALGMPATTADGEAYRLPN